MMTSVLSILIPVYNEESTIKELFLRVKKAKTPRYRKQVIIIDDGSTDQTGKVLRELRKKYNFTLLTHSQNKGKGAAIKTGLKKAVGRIILTQDADLEYHPSDIQSLLKVYRPQLPVIYGSRNMGTTKRGYLLCHWTGRVLSFIFNTLFASHITDINTGYKLFRADILRQCRLQVDGFDFCHEVTAKVLRRGYLIQEVPISYSPRTWKEGKKVRPKDAWLDLWTTVKYRLVKLP